MKLYNGSKDNGNIKEFSTKHTRDGFVYATSSRLVALTYVANVYPEMFVSGFRIKPWVEKYPKMFEGIGEDQELFIELIPNFLDLTTKNREGWIYEFEEPSSIEPISQGKKCGHIHCYRTEQNLKVIAVEHIKDSRAELQKYIDSGELKIIKYEDADKNFVLERSKEYIDFDKMYHKGIKNNYIQYIKDFYKDIIE